MTGGGAASRGMTGGEAGEAYIALDSEAADELADEIQLREELARMFG